jgi:hypothetical protein
MKIKAVKQRIEVLSQNIDLFHIFYYNDGFGEWLRMASYTDDMGIACISSCIAEALNYYFGERFEITHGSEEHDCECCGYYTISTTTISKDNASVEIVEDSHMGYETRGLGDEEVIEDWELFDYEVEIENI